MDTRKCFLQCYAALKLKCVVTLVFYCYACSAEWWKDTWKSPFTFLQYWCKDTWKFDVFLSSTDERNIEISMYFNFMQHKRPQCQYQTWRHYQYRYSGKILSHEPFDSRLFSYSREWNWNTLRKKEVKENENDLLESQFISWYCIISTVTFVSTQSRGNN